jgi:predicted phosphodiesterase
MITGEVVKEYLTKFPNTPTLTLAKCLYKDNPAMFKTVEHARKVVRYYRGATGKKEKEKLLDTRFTGYEGKANPFDELPEGLKYFSDWSPYMIQGKKTLIMGDIHAPYYEKEPLRIALEFGKQNNVDTVVLLGDLIDFYAVSHWEKDPRRRDVQSEINSVKTILRLIRTMFPNAEIIFKLGNHDERLERYLRVKAPELLHLECLNLKSLLDPKDEFGIKTVPDKRIVKIGHLNIIHGHEFGHSFFSPVNPARGLYLRGKETCICAHYHRTSQHTEKSMSENIVACWSIGALCDLRPEYLPMNNWNHGFAIVERDGKEFHCQNFKIIKGKIY